METLSWTLQETANVPKETSIMVKMIVNYAYLVVKYVLMPLNVKVANLQYLPEKVLNVHVLTVTSMMDLLNVKNVE